MTAIPLDPVARRVPGWLPGLAGFGVLWNLYGVAQFVDTLTPSGRAAMAAGMTPEQAQLIFSLPAWMTAVFALGVFGGLLGSLVLLARRAAALPVLGASLAGYGALFAGDLHFGVFDAKPSQLAILAFVVFVAVVLFTAGRRARARGLLR